MIIGYVPLSIHIYHLFDCPRPMHIQGFQKASKAHGALEFVHLLQPSGHFSWGKWRVYDGKMEPNSMAYWVSYGFLTQKVVEVVFALKQVDGGFWERHLLQYMGVPSHGLASKPSIVTAGKTEETPGCSLVLMLSVPSETAFTSAKFLFSFLLALLRVFIPSRGG